MSDEATPKPADPAPDPEAQVLGTAAHAAVYVNVLLEEHLRSLKEQFQHAAHAAPEPGQRRDAHLVLAAIRNAVQGLEATNLALMASEARVVVVTADSRPDKPPPGRFRQ